MKSWKWTPREIGAKVTYFTVLFWFLATLMDPYFRGHWIKTANISVPFIYQCLIIAKNVWGCQKYLDTRFLSILVIFFSLGIYHRGHPLMTSRSHIFSDPPPTSVTTSTYLSDVSFEQPLVAKGMVIRG